MQVVDKGVVGVELFDELAPATQRSGSRHAAPHWCRWRTRWGAAQLISCLITIHSHHAIVLRLVYNIHSLLKATIYTLLARGFGLQIKHDMLHIWLTKLTLLWVSVFNSNIIYKHVNRTNTTYTVHSLLAQDKTNTWDVKLYKRNWNFACWCVTPPAINQLIMCWGRAWLTAHTQQCTHSIHCAHSNAHTAFIAHKHSRYTISTNTRNIGQWLDFRCFYSFYIATHRQHGNAQWFLSNDWRTAGGYW